MERDYKKEVFVPSPWRLFVQLMVMIFTVEAAIMLFLSTLYLREHGILTDIADAVLLDVLSAPLLWYLMVRPLRNLAAAEHIQAATIVSRSLDGIITANERDLIESFNPAAEAIFGYRAEEVLGKPLTLLMPERYHEAHREGLKRASSKGESRIIGKTVELRGLRKEGNDFPLELSLAAWKVGRDARYVCFMRDITERKLADERMRRNLEQLRILNEIGQAVNSTLALQAVLNLLLNKIDETLPYAATTLRLHNQQTRSLEPVISRNRDEEQWKRSSEVDKSIAQRGLSKAVFKSVAPLIVPNVQTDARSVQPELFRKQGLVSFLGLPLIADGEVLGVLGVYTKKPHDFTDEEVKFFSTVVAQVAAAIRNAQLYEQLRQQATELDKANKLQADFTAMIIHDLRSPLMNIMSIASVLEDGLFGEMTAEQKKWAGKIIINSSNLADLISDILDLSKLEAGHIKLVKERFDFGEFARNSLEDYLPRVKGKRLSLSLNLDSDVGRIEADPRRLNQVLGNLVGNAIKFTPEGGAIEVGARREGSKEVKLWVKDSGVGIPPDEIGSLFQKYCQVSSAKAAGETGTGLGLVICKMIAEAHGGYIEVESEPGKGSTFTLTLPLIRQESGDQADALKPEGKTERWASRSGVCQKSEE